MEERNRIRYETLFYCQKLEDGFLSGDNARALFIRSKLPLLDLTKIWKLSDITRDNKLDVFEFSLAMHFIELNLMGGEIPKQHNITIPDNNQEVVFPIITVEAKQQIKDIFEYADTNSQGFLEMDIVKPMLLSSGLSPSTLSRIWNIADLDRIGKLCLFEFTIALHLVKNCAKGINLNGPVNPFACLPDEDNAVRLYKEKLAIFDKEFLLKQQNNDDELFLNSCSGSADPAALELLTGYLFDGQHGSSRGKSKPDFVDENRNVFHGGNENSPNGYHQHNLSQDCDIKEEQSVDSTETIECNKVNKNELNIDLESIFETASKENMGESEEVPKFIAQPPVQFAETEEDEEEIPVLPTFQRRTYFGKDLIFEDPIGSELIGDVEFEVDFNYIINDIEKEMVDEERRLPIARVLPIYKTPPVLDEQPCEKSMTTKGSRDVDLNFIDVKTAGVYEQENRSPNSRPTNLVVGTVTTESQKSHKGMMINEGSTGYNDDIYTNSRKENTKNIDNVSCTVDDIVEQKRLLLQIEQEERKKYREGRHNTEQINNDKSSYSNRQEKDTKIQNNLNDTNYSAGVQSQRKNNWSVAEKEGVAATSSISGGGNYMNEKETKIAGIVNLNQKDGYNESNNENNYEDKEEKRKLREAEDKEIILLERINFLEKKRQQLYEKKRRERDSRNVVQEHKVYGNQEVKKNNMQVLEKSSNHQEQNLASATSPDPWSNNSKHDRKEKNEDERRRLAEALAAKRKTEAELQREREKVLRAAEERRLEEEAKQQEEQEAAKERKRNFLENLQRLKQRVRTEEEEKSKESKNQLKREPNRVVHNAGRFSPDIGSPNKSLSAYTKGNDISTGMDSSNTMQKNVLPQTRSSQYEANVENKHQDRNESNSIKPEENLRNEEDQEKADEMRRENFKSNRELFLKKIQTKSEQNVQVPKRESSKKVRPKSFYGGMFNKPVHQIIDDSLLVQNVDSTSVGDLVDEEALKQFQREQELKKEHEKVNKLRSSLERESSYTVENVEKLFCETETEITKQAGNDWDNVRKKEAKASSHPHRRSLVNTLTTEWDSFLDILEDDKRRESETIKMRQEISAQRKCSHARTSVTTQASVTTPVDVVKSDISKEILQEKEIFAKQTGNVKKLVTSYKRLSVPCFLSQDDTWSIENSGEDSDTFERNVQAKNSPKSYKQEPDDKRFDQKTIIKENAPKRKAGLAHAWEHVISNQQNTDE